jgi:DNA repair protein RecN (Recombination protein N)
MILELEIKHFPILEDVNVRFGPGLNLFTGETGAGKSLIIDAIEFLMGYSSIQGEVQGIFKPSEELKKILSQEGFDIEEELYISRESRAGGKTISRMNGTFVPVQKIKDISPYLVEIHGQHGYHSLFDLKTHLALLDHYGGDELLRVRQSYADLYKSWRSAEKDLERLIELEKTRERELDLCQYEVKEIEEARLRDGEEESLREEKEKLTQISRLQELLQELLEQTDRIPFQKILSSLEKLSLYEKKLSPWHSKFQEWDYEWIELKEVLNSCRTSFLPDPARLEQIIERLDLIHHLKKKYGSAISEILVYFQKRKQELTSLEQFDDDLKKAEENFKRLENQLRETGTVLSEKRRRTAQNLEKEILKEFKLLAFSHAEFKVSFENLEFWSPAGKEKIEFLVSLNPGQPVLPLAKAASGGELSRIMLALRSLLASKHSETFIFDEIDSGLGGEAAFHLAERLKMLAADHQVLCVTHLHQVAAAADWHFFVEKQVINGKTQAAVRLLEGEGKVQELARMMGGERKSAAVLQHARELLQASRGKNGIRGS